MAGSMDETGTAKVKGPASYFPSIEKTYGQPIDHWLDLRGPAHSTATWRPSGG